jgi:hypothetical protein
MLAMMVLGAPQIYGCRTHVASGTPGEFPPPYLDMCPGVMSSEMIEMGPRKEISDMDGWSRTEGHPLSCNAARSQLHFQPGRSGRHGQV